ncbi:MAG: hypothetical protein EOP83_31170 [Verrucomicrobiaceae bacterium]|nr:MAG: hypothetical protein EOP83_31170 [Verrucomicrobiaceae bacterium]
MGKIRYHPATPKGDVYLYAFQLITPESVGYSRARHEYQRGAHATIRAWCEEQFGLSGPEDSRGRPFRITSTRAKFKRETDALAFKLRWT